MDDDDYDGSGGDSPGRANLQCDVCGSTEFITESGFYYCTECNTQSQVSQYCLGEG